MPATPALDDATASPSRLADDFRIVRSRALRGANVWSLTPVILTEIRLGALAELGPDHLPQLMERLLAALPALELEGLNAPLPDATREHGPAAWWGTLLVRVAVELQRLAGAPAPQGRVVLSAPGADRWTIVMTFEEEDFAIQAARQAARVMRDALRGDDPEIGETVDALRRALERTRPDPSTRAIIAAARRRGIPVRRSLDTDTVQLGLGIMQRRVLGGATERTSVLAAYVAADQRRVRRIISGVGVPVPVGDAARSLDDALEIARDIGFPVRLVRDAVALGAPLPDDDALTQAWNALDDGAPASVERAVAGERYAVLVVAGHTVAARTLDAAPRAVPLDALHASVRATCELAAGAVGLDVASVELVMEDAGAPLRAKGGVVTAVRANPELSSFVAAEAGVEGDPADAVVRMLFPRGAPATIPVVTITGTNGKTTTTRLIAHLFRQTGRTVGFTTTDGVYLQEQLLMYGDLTGPFAANVILSHREVEVAVLETARGGILKSGLGFEESDVAVVMNVTADHLGLGGIDTVQQLADVKAVLPAVVKAGGHAVLNADDPLVLAMRERTRGHVALFSTRPAGENAEVEAHLANEGIVARVEMVDAREHLVIRDGALRIDLGAGAEVPLTFGGLARFQVQNVLAACTAAYVQGVTAEQIRAGLATFLPSSEATPGRLNLVETPRGRVLLDYAHNAAAISGLIEFVRAMPARRRMALLSAPGDRRDEDLREIGRLAQGLDLVIMKEHEVYRRGRAPGAIADLMADGLRETGCPEERILTFVEEHDAVAHVMALMEPDDIVIIIADDSVAVRRQLDAMR